jgi:hypothetical protein
MASPDDISAALHEQLETRLDRVRAATVPVYLEAQPEPEHIGSGILMRIGDERFLFTAAHVADLRSRGALYLGGESFPIRLAGTITHSVPPQGDRRRDNIDAAVLHLPATVNAHLRDHEFLGLEDIDLGLALHHDDYFLVAGYPVTKQRFRRDASTIDAYLYPFVAVSRTDDAYASHDPTVHVLLGFRKKDMWRRDIGRSSAPDLYGMSGGGIWWLPDYTRPAFKRPLLHSIATEWHAAPHCHILGTRIHVFLSAVWRDFPELWAHFRAPGATTS